MKQCTVVTSLSSEEGMTQAGLLYLCTALRRKGITFDILNLSGTISFYAPPDELRAKCDSPEWMNADSVRHADWMDEYLPLPDLATEVVLFSAQFSPDLVFHAHYSARIKASDPGKKTIIGGAALRGMRDDQLELLSIFCDHILIGYDVEGLLDSVLNGNGEARGECIIRKMSAPTFRPDYSVLDLHEFVTVYTGHGCYYAGCRFCDFPSRADEGVSFISSHQVASEMHDILTLRPDVQDLFLSHDSYTRGRLLKTADEIHLQCGQAPYSLMMRAEPWAREDIAEKLAATGCNDVFIGAEGLDDEILGILNKGLSTAEIVAAVKSLSKFVDVTIGMILFVPGISERALTAQLRVLEDLIPHLSGIDLEVLTIVNGSEFARDPFRHGIILNATENVLNDSWCFGLSHDIPWTMADPAQISRWFKHAKDLRTLCGSLVPQVYWDSIEGLEEDLCCATLT